MYQHHSVDGHTGRMRSRRVYGDMISKSGKVYSLPGNGQHYLSDDETGLCIPDEQLDLLGNRYLEGGIEQACGVSFEAYLLRPLLYDCVVNSA